MLKQPLIRILFITCFVFAVASCGSHRKGASPVGGDYTPEGTLVWTDLSVPLSVSIQSPMSLKVNGVMSMINGKDIHISLRMFGFEVGAACVTSDSIYAYAKMQKVYVAESIRRVLAGADMSLADIQSMLITDKPVRLPSLGGGRSVSVSHEPLDGSPLASAVTINAVLTEKNGADKTADNMRRLSVTISYDWEDARSDTGETKSFAIPKGYRRIDASALMKLL